MIQIEAWHLITFFIAFVAFAAGAFKMLVSQFNKSLDVRFEQIERARTEAQKHWEERFNELRMLEREFLEFRAELPMKFILREDYVRGQTVIEAKLDAVYSKLELVQLRGVKP